MTVYWENRRAVASKSRHCALRRAGCRDAAQHIFTNFMLGRSLAELAARHRLPSKSGPLHSLVFALGSKAGLPHLTVRTPPSGLANSVFSQALASA
jgi:hypothetical protein